MSPEPEVYYRLAPGVHAVPLVDGSVLFRSDAVSIRVDGDSARWLAQQVIPLLDGRRGFSEVASLLTVSAPGDLRQHLDSLVEAWVLRREDRSLGDSSAHEAALEPWLNFLHNLGIAAPSALETLAGARVAIFGLEGHGAHLATTLARCGVGTLTLVDPFPCQAGNLALLPGASTSAIGRPRQDVIRDVVKAQGGRTEVIAPEGVVTRESVAAAVEGCHFVVGCFDKGFSAANHWINRASLEYGIPALFAESRGHVALVGPLVIPGQTACYMCYRMRSLACADDFPMAMSYEEFLDGRKRPALHESGTAPALPSLIGGVMSLEVTRYLLNLGSSALAAKIMEWDVFTLRSTLHPVLQSPECPDCGKKKTGCEPRPHSPS